LKALPFGFDGRGQRLLLPSALEDRLLMAQDRLLAILERLLQVRYALRQGLKGRAATRFHPKLVEGRDSFLIDLLETCARFSKHFLGLRGACGSEKPADGGAQDQAEEQECRNCDFHFRIGVSRRPNIVGAVY
jgi:hypothetical protein